MSDVDVGKQRDPLLVAAVAAGVSGFFLLLTVVGGIATWKLLDKPAPAPVPTPAVELVVDLPDEARPFVAAFYRDMIAVVDTGLIKTKEQFLDAHAVATLVLDKAEGDLELGSASDTIQNYLLDVLGQEPGPLVPEIINPALEGLASALD